MRDIPLSVARVRQYFYEVLEAPSHRTLGGMSINRFLGTLIIASLASTVFATVPHLQAKFGYLFDTIETLSLAVFSLEYCLRVWIAPEHIPYRHLRSYAARRAFVLSPQGIIDFVAIVPFWIALAGLGDLRVLIVLRILRVLKFTRYSAGMRALLDVLWSERRALIGCVVILTCATLVSASVMHIVEGDTQPDKFGTIPDAMWWSIVTLSTIGYGDVVPVTGPGRAVAAVTIIAGLIMIALPVGIVATAFSEAIHRRDFIVTWSMVARVPLFSRLTAGDIAHIMQLLRAQQVEAGSIIARRGEPAHSMYFIAEGEVEIELGPHRKNRNVRLGPGHFFGERAILKKTDRSSTVMAASRVKLLVLEASDFTSLIAREPAIAEHINQVAIGRGARRPPIEYDDLGPAPEYDTATEFDI
jgi:voltage-gated potassium channel